MQTFNRQGIHIEQCAGCGGIFLDRGELEQIVLAEQRHYTAPHYAGGHSDSPPPYQGHRDSPPPYYGHRDSPPPYHPGHTPRPGHYSDSPPPYGHRRRRSFLEELFD